MVNAIDYPPAPLSLSDTMDSVMRQVEYNCFADFRTRLVDPLYIELCLIISEVFLMDPEMFVKVNGSVILTRLVQDVYLRLRNDHLRLVFSNFQSVYSKIYNKKAYLRTALYNSVFELESSFINDALCI
jgi:hypothetical protein